MSAVSVGMLAAPQRGDVSLVARSSRPSRSFMVHVVLGEHLRARLDRERLDRLLRTAEEIHSSVDTDAVTSSLAHSAKELLRARDAWVGTTAPGHGRTWRASSR